MYKFKIGKANLSYNFADADKIEKYENALKTVGIAMSNPPTDQPLSVQVRFICGTVMNMFDDLFGQGVAKQIFGESTDLSLCSQALKQLVEAQRKADEVVATEMIQIADYIKGEK